MAKNWMIEKSRMVRKYAGETLDLVIDLEDLFPGIDEDYDEAQVGAILNGVKQKLDDTIARSKDMKLTEAEKREAQEALWNRLSTERKWNMPKQAKGPRGPAVSYKVIVPALEDSGLDVEAIAATLSTTVERVQPFMTKKEEVTE